MIHNKTSTGCGLPICQESCQESLQHQPECEAFQGAENCKQLSMALLDDIPSLLDVIMIIRCLNLRQSDNDEWFKFNQLQGRRALVLQKNMCFRFCS